MLFVWFCVLVSAFIGRVVTEQLLPPGSAQDVPVNRTDVLEEAQFCVDEFNKGNTEDVFNYAILDITSAKVQVVQGLNYFLEMLLGPTTCKTGNAVIKGNAAAVKGNAAPNECDSNSEPKNLKCTFTVNVIHWQDSRDLFQKECKSTTDSD